MHTTEIKPYMKYSYGTSTAQRGERHLHHRNALEIVTDESSFNLWRNYCCRRGRLRPGECYKPIHFAERQTGPTTGIMIQRKLREKSTRVIDHEISVFVHKFLEESRGSRTRQISHQNWPPTRLPKMMPT
ncbi:hypothetical protein TNCV_4720861 [Trichonephila clavipes]|uniref:Uncharacterized protein n=1 Tax=Trichonephila clavipes TaxID=2585209 RepID=A0A8X6W617_TRICX|nr:hypothetical protein TNCV_4720861 [Trichonephila clavipes]